MSLFAPLHPRFVHFPIALLLTGSMAALIYLLARRRPALATFAWISLVLGWLALFPVVLTGLIDQNQVPARSGCGGGHQPAHRGGFWPDHRVWTCLARKATEPSCLDEPKRRLMLLLLLTLGIGLITLEGWLGGKLVYDLGVGVQGP